MEWKSREITHDYNLRSLNRPRLRSRTRDQRNQNDASSSNGHQESSHQDSRNPPQQRQQRRDRSRRERRRDRSQEDHRRDRSQEDHRRDRSQRRRRMNSTRRAHKALSGIPASSSDKPDDDDVKCVICIDTVNDTEMKRVRCGHSFHRKCCNNWLKINNACPVCRTVVAPKRICVDNPNRERIIDDTPISDIIYFFTLSVMSDLD